jgi:hypothetical protein
MNIKKIISGGQTGACQAALDVAINLGIPHGGWIPKGRITEKGLLPEKYLLKEMTLSSYSKCTEKNVIDSDGTLIIHRGKISGGSELALKYAGNHQRECLCIDLDINRGFVAAQLIKAWIIENNIKVLNVAGPRASKDSDIYADSARLLRAVYQLFFIETKRFEPSKLKPLYPRTVKEAVDRLFSELPFKEKTSLAKLEENSLELLPPDLGNYIRDNYGIKFKKGELIKDCRFMAKDNNITEEGASEVIIKELWKKLRKTHALRVVK